MKGKKKFAFSRRKEKVYIRYMCDTQYICACERETEKERERAFLFFSSLCFVCLCAHTHFKEENQKENKTVPHYHISKCSLMYLQVSTHTHTLANFFALRGVGSTRWERKAFSTRVINLDIYCELVCARARVCVCEGVCVFVCMCVQGCVMLCWFDAHPHRVYTSPLSHSPHTYIQLLTYQ